MTTEELVKKVCKEKGISVARLAAKLGQSRQNFCKKLQRNTLTVEEWERAAQVLDVTFDQAFVLPDGTRMGITEQEEKHIVLPLMGSAFAPGKAEETVESFRDPGLREIARGELYFFSAQAENCAKTVEKYLTSDDLALRLSADMLYTFANFTLGNAKKAQKAREDVYRCLEKELETEKSRTAAAGTVSRPASDRAAVVCHEYAGACGLSERRVCESAGHGTDGDGHDGKDVSDSDDLSELRCSDVPDQPEGSGGGYAVGVKCLGDGAKRQVSGTIYRIPRTPAGHTGIVYP